MFNDEELENIQIAIGAVLDAWALTPEGIEKFKALEAKVLSLRESHLTMRAPDPPSALICTCGSVGGRIHNNDCPLANTAGG